MRTLTTLSLVLALLSVDSGAVFSQDAAGATGSRRSRAVVDVEIEAGTVVSYFEILRERYALNILVDPSLAQTSIRMPAVRLRNVSPEAVATLPMEISEAADHGLEVVEHDSIFVARIRTPVRPSRRRSQQVENRIQTVVNSLAPMLRSPTPTKDELTEVDKLLRAIDQAVELLGAETKPIIRVHPESKILLMRGEQEPLLLASEVIEHFLSLREESTLDEENRKLRAEIATLKADLEKSQLHLLELNHMLQLEKERVAAAKQAAEDAAKAASEAVKAAAGQRP